MGQSKNAWRAICLAILIGSTGPALAAAEQPGSHYQTGAEISGYLGVVPAEIVKGHPVGHAERTMHGGPPPKAHEYHVIVALFDTATGARITNAAVSVTIFGPGNTLIYGQSHPTPSGSKPSPLPRTPLEPMTIAGTITYGGFFELPEATSYTIQVTARRPGASRPVVLNFNYDNQ